MQNIKTYKWIILIFSYYIYPFVLNGVAPLSYSITYGIPFIYIVFNAILLVQFIGKIKKHQFLCLFIVCFLFLASIVYPMLHQTNDFSYITPITFVFRKLLVYIFLCLIIIKRYKEKASPELFMYYFCVATFLYVISTFLFLWIDPLKTFWISKVNSENIVDRFANVFGYVARTGWQGFSGVRNTLRCSLSIVFLLYLFYEKKQMNRKIFEIIFVFSFIGNLFYGRSGVAISIACILIALCQYRIIKFSVILRWLLASVGLLTFIFFLQKINPLLNQWYIWMSRPFINLLITGSFNNSSVDKLREMIFLPETKTMIWGDGWYVFNNSYYMHTDSGFMRQILFWGLPLTVLSYYATWLSMKSFRGKKVFLLFMIVFILFEVKVEVYFEFISWMLSISFLENWRERMERLKGNNLNG